LGADEFIDYTAAPFEQVVTEMDVVFDTVGGDTFERAFATLRRGGVLVTSVAFPSDQAARHNVRAERVFCKPDAEALLLMRELVESQKLIPHVSKTVPLAEIKHALELSEQGHTRGKIVVEIGE